MFGLLFYICLIFCFQLIVPQHYDIIVNPIIWLPLSPVEQLYSNNQLLIITASRILVLKK